MLLFRVLSWIAFAFAVLLLALLSLLSETQQGYFTLKLEYGETELKKLCEHAYVCFHDRVIICGKSVNEARTFLDLCDLYEYSCEYNMVFRHVKDEEGVCPNQKELAPGVG